MRKEYNEELKGAMDDEDHLKIVNDPNILACTILGTTICKSRLRIVVTLLTCISVYKGLVMDIVKYTNKPQLPNLILLRTESATSRIQRIPSPSPPKATPKLKYSHVVKSTLQPCDPGKLSPDQSCV